MIKRLRVKFIVVSMISLFVVLLVILGAIGILNYLDLTDEADRTLWIIADNDGVFPRPDKFLGMRDKLNHFSPELPYELRYFSVLLNEDGEAVETQTGSIAAVDAQSAVRYASSVAARGQGRGFYGSYRYLCLSQEDGTRVVFLDCGRNLATFRSFVLTGGWIALLGMLAVLFLLILLSGRVVKPVAESYEKQKRFITDAGHEIKTPITIIDADAEVLEMEIGVNEWLRDIRLQAKRLTQLTGDLIYLSRMEEENTRLQMIEFPFSDLVTETAQSFQALARAQDKRFSLSVEPMISLCGEEKALRQLVTILLDNALKYTPAGGEISLSLKRQGKQVNLVATNTTHAVSSEQLAHLFDRFYRGDPARSPKGGYGIGLSIAKAVVTAHRGKISASCPDGHTLRMSVTFNA